MQRFKKPFRWDNKTYAMLKLILIISCATLVAVLVAVVEGFVVLNKLELLEDMLRDLGR